MRRRTDSYVLINETTGESLIFLFCTPLLLSRAASHLEGEYGFLTPSQSLWLYSLVACFLALSREKQMEVSSRWNQSAKARTPSTDGQVGSIDLLSDFGNVEWLRNSNVITPVRQERYLIDNKFLSSWWLIYNEGYSDLTSSLNPCQPRLSPTPRSLRPFYSSDDERIC